MLARGDDGCMRVRASERARDGRRTVAVTCVSRAQLPPLRPRQTTASVMPAACTRVGSPISIMLDPPASRSAPLLEPDRALACLPALLAASSSRRHPADHDVRPGAASPPADLPLSQPLFSQETASPRLRRGFPGCVASTTWEDGHDNVRIGGGVARPSLADDERVADSRQDTTAGRTSSGAVASGVQKGRIRRPVCSTALAAHD